MKRPRVLFVTADVPRDGGSGGQIVSWRLVQSYSRFCSVDVLALVAKDAAAPTALSVLAERVGLSTINGFYSANARARTLARFIGAQIAGPPFRIRKFASTGAAALLGEWRAQQTYDLVHCDHLSTAQYRSLFPETPAILMEHNVEWELFEHLAEQSNDPLRRCLLRREARSTRRYESASLGTFDHIFALSERDAALLRDARPDVRGRISVWPVPVSASAATRDRPLTPPRLLILGSLRSVGRLQGLRWFCHNVWPLVRRTYPDAALDIVGAQPPADVQALDGIDGVRVYGFLDDIDPLLDAVTVCVIPLFVGGGVRIKVLEMLVRGIPCIGSPVGLQGFEDLGGCCIVTAPSTWVTALGADSLASLRLGAARSSAALARQQTSLRSSEALRHVVDVLVRQQHASRHAVAAAHTGEERTGS